MVGGYIPPVLHSFLYNFKVFKVKQKETKTNKWIYAPQSSTISDLSHTWTVLLVE